jgi:hypothetical protein
MFMSGYGMSSNRLQLSLEVVLRWSAMIITERKQLPETLWDRLKK